MSVLIMILPLWMSLFCFGLYYSGEEGMILETWKKNLRSKSDRGFFPMPLAKPIWLCSVCMNSIWGSLVYWSFAYFIIKPGLKVSLIFWPISVVIAVGLGIMLESVYSSLKKRPDGHPRTDPSIDNRTGTRLCSKR